MMLFSPGLCAFFNAAINEGSIPEDAVEITDAQYAVAIELQSKGKQIRADANGFPIAVDSPTTQSDIVWFRIKARRDAIKAGGVKVGAKWFHTDDASRIQHMALNMMGSNIPANLQWKTMDGSFVTMTQALAGQVFQAVATLDMNAFAVAEQHRVAMEASAEPASYDFSTGWPETFAG